MSAPAGESGAGGALSPEAAPATASDSDAVHLGDCVRDALGRYFEALDGHECRDLFSLVMREVEQPLLEAVLAHCGGSRTKAALMLGIHRGTLRKKLQQYELD